MCGNTILNSGRFLQLNNCKIFTCKYHNPAPRITALSDPLIWDWEKCLIASSSGQRIEHPWRASLLCMVRVFQCSATLPVKKFFLISNLNSETSVLISLLWLVIEEQDSAWHCFICRKWFFVLAVSLWH